MVVTRGDLNATVTASGQFQPNTIVTIRPDSNMPTRKIVKIDVAEGQRVSAGQPLARIDPTGLDLTLKGDEAAYLSALAKLKNLKARPADMDLAAAQVLKGRKVAKWLRCIVLPGSYAIYLEAMKEGLIETFIEAGCAVGPSSCGPCLGGHLGILAAGERAVATKRAGSSL